MSFLKELTDKGATVAWSAVAAHPNLIALGTKDAGGGSGFEDYGGELELHMLEFSREAEDGGGTGTVLGKVKTSARFANLAWSGMCTKQAEYPYGLIAGGMGDGTVNIWDPAKMVANHPQPQVTSVQRHTGPVTGLHFNPHKSSSHLLASGGADCEVFIMSLDRPDAPTVFVPGPQNTARHTAEVTKVAWNSQVSHIMATAAQNGSCIVWDLKQKKPWCELRDPNRAPITDLAWNPDQGQHIITASGDDNNPVLKLWDLRSSTTLPLATLAGHTEGVLSVAWCPFDASLLMSCAKDNRTLLWDLFSLKPVYELSPGAGEAAASQPESNQMFGGYGKTAQRRYQVSWAPHIPTVVATCSFDRKVQLFSMNGASTSNERAPKWHRRPAGASFGFGGRLVYFSSSQGLQFQQRGQAAGGDRGSDKNSVVKISLVKEDAAFVAASRRFEEAMASKGFEEFCLEKEASATTAHERKVWQFMQVTFLRDARKQLLTHLGVDKDAVARQAAAFVAASSGDDHDHLHLHHKESFKDSGENVLDDENLADREGAPDEAELSAAMDGIDLGASKEEKSGRLFPGRALMGFLGARGGGQGGTPSVGPLISAEAEAVIKRSLLVGNFEAAVQCCMATGNTADAMILASCGGTDLWAKTQAQYFAREMERRPFLKMVNAIIKSELGGLVESSDLNQWQETLAILSTYAKHPEFPQLCEALAARLENEAGDRKSAILCYMCAIKVSKTVNIWAEELRAANAAMNGGTDTKALQEFVEKVSVFTQESKEPPGNEVSAIFAEYANILASEGETKTAFKYVNEGQTNSCAVLLDRLYHAAPHASAGTPEPPFPFERVPVGVSSQTAVKEGSEMHANGKNASHGQGNTQVDPRGKAAVGGVEPPLPSGWTQMTDPSRGIPYYCNTATGQTQWERPPPPAQPQRQPQPQPQLQPQPNVAAWGHRQAVPATPTQASFTPTRLAQQQQQQYANPAFGGNPASVTSEGPPSTFVPSYGGPSAFTPVNVQRQQQPQYQQQQQQPLLHQPQQLPLQPQYQQQQLPQQQQQPQPQPQYQQQQRLAAMGAPSSALATGGPGAMGGASSAAPRMLGAHPSPYESRAAAASVGPGAPSNFQGGGGMQASEVATPGAGLHGMREGGEGAPIARNAHDYGGAAPSAMVPGQSPVPASSAASSSSQTKDASEEPPPPPASDAESQAVVSTMEEILGALSEVQLSGTEKKMMGDVTKAAGILFAKMSRNQVERDTLTKVGYLVDALQARDVKGANAIQQGLADSAWQNHKDWLKGLKHLTTLVSRRL